MRTKRSIRSAAAVLAAMSCPVVAAAQDGDFEPEETVTVVATRTEQALNEVAATVTVKMAENLEREIARDIADLVRFEPGVTVAGTGDRFGLSGFNIRGIGGNRVLTLVDGVRVPEEFSFGPFLSSRRDFVDIDSLNRVEIARGPISSLYGSDALGGVVAFATRQPRDYLSDDRAFAGTFKGGYSGADDSTVGTMSLAGATGPFAGVVLYTRRTGRETANSGSNAGHGPDREQPDPQSIDSGNLTAKFDFSPSDMHEFMLSVDRYRNDTESRILSDYGISVFGTMVDRRDASDTRSRNRWSLAYRYAGGSLLADHVQATIYRQHSDSAQLTEEDRTPPGRAAMQFRQRASFFEQEINGAWIQFDKSFDTGSVSHLATYGVDYYSTDNASLRDGGTVDAAGAPQREFTRLPTRDFPLTAVTQLALFAQDEIAFLKGALIVSPSLRFDRFDADARTDEVYLHGNLGAPAVEDYDDSEVTAKLGAVYSFGDALSAYARYSEGFRAPPYDDVNVGFNNPPGGYKSIANPALESERSQGLEIGLRLRARRGQAQLAVFRNDYENFTELSLAPQFLSMGGVDRTDGLRTFQSVNRDVVEIRGWELRGSFDLGAGLTARAAIAGAEGRDRDRAEPLNSIEPLHAVLGLGYDAPRDLWGANIIWTGARGKSEEDIDSEDPRLAPPGYGILDLLAYANIGDGIRLNAGLFNLTDRSYIRWSDTAGIGDDAPARFTQPGFNAGLTLRVEF